MKVWSSEGAETPIMKFNREKQMQMHLKLISEREGGEPHMIDT